jgi:peptide/nickel transport system permease protein
MSNNGAMQLQLPALGDVSVLDEPGDVSRDDSEPASVGRLRFRLARRRALRLGHYLLRRPGFVLALLFTAAVVLAAVYPTAFTGVDPMRTVPREMLRPPSLAHPFGTDQLGRDLFSRVVHGSSLTIRAALLAVTIALVVGLVLGVLSGFVGGVLDAVAMRVVDVMLAIPGLLLALAIVTALGFGTIPVAIAVGVGIAPGFTRTTRAEVLKVRSLPYIEAIKVGGATWLRLVVRHVLPNSWGPVAALTVLEFGAAVLSVAGLSFLGFGVAPPAAEWGTLIANGRAFIATAPWVSLMPGLVVAGLVFGLTHISRSLAERGR